MGGARRFLNWFWAFLGGVAAIVFGITLMSAYPLLGGGLITLGVFGLLAEMFLAFARLGEWRDAKLEAACVQEAQDAAVAPLRELYARGNTLRQAEIARLMFGEKTQAERMPIFIEKYKMWRQDAVAELADKSIALQQFSRADPLLAHPDWLTPDDLAIPLECLRGIINGAEGWKL